MAVTAVSLKTLPCPFCHHPVDEHSSVIREAVRHGVDCLELQCDGCGKQFTHYRELTRSAATAPAAARALTAATSKKATLPTTNAGTWFTAALVAAGVEYLTRGAGPQTFLVVYAALFIGCYATSLGNGLARRLVGLACFELTGILRWQHALSTGHPKLMFLLLMMVIGGLLLLVEWDSGNGGGPGNILYERGYGYGRVYCHGYYSHCSGCGGGWSHGWGSGGGGSSGGSGGGGCGGCGS